MTMMIQTTHSAHFLALDADTLFSDKMIGRILPPGYIDSSDFVSWSKINVAR